MTVAEFLERKSEWRRFAVLNLTVRIERRYSSLSGLIACEVTPALLWAFNQPSAAVLFLVLALLVFIMHRANIVRLMAGTETRIGQSAVKP